jgi:hypothetical protein
MAVKNIHGTRIPTGFRDLYSIILFLHNKVINQMGVIKGCHKEGISLSNPLALLHSILHGVDVLCNPVRNLFLVRPSVRLDSVRSLFHRPMNVLAVVNEILNRGPITTVAASLVVLTSRIRHYGAIIIDLVPTAALTVTASSVSSSLSAPAKAIVKATSIRIHHHGGFIGDLFLVPTTALTVTASSVSSSLSATTKAIVKATSISIHHHGGIVGDLFLVPTTALTVTASSVSFSLSAATKAIVETCSIMIHRHGVCALLLFPTPTLAATSISASSITASTHASPSTARKLHSISFQHCQTRKDK